MMYTNKRAKEIIDDYIHSERDRKIICRKIVDGITYERIAEEFNLSVSQVKRIICKNTDIIFMHLKMN